VSVKWNWQHDLDMAAHPRSTRGAAPSYPHLALFQERRIRVRDLIDTLRTLMWCNKRRRERGWGPLLVMPEDAPYAPGTTSRSHSCPVARASGCFIATTYWEYDIDEYRLPVYVMRYTARKDRENSMALNAQA